MNYTIANGMNISIAEERDWGQLEPTHGQGFENPQELKELGWTIIEVAEEWEEA